MKRYTRHILFSLIAVMASFAWAPPAMAQTEIPGDITPWNGTVASSFAGGDGSETNPYQVATAEQLALIGAEIDGACPYTAAGLYFVQTSDIDLNGSRYAWKPIGKGTNATADITKAFKGTYDGNGYAINNMYVKTDGQSNANAAFGLFGYANGANFRNITINNALLKRTAAGSGSIAVKYGVLVGAYAPLKCASAAAARQQSSTRYIENIIINSATITDNGIDSKSQSYFIGGLIGDFTSGIGGYDKMTDASEWADVKIRNIYADVDIDMNASTRKYSNSQYTEANIGGIVGRMRYPRDTYLPDYTYFEGDVKPGQCAVGPVWGAVRSTAKSDSTLLDMTQAYAGNPYSTGTSLMQYNGNPAADAHRYFGPYRVYEAAAGEGETPRGWVAFTDTKGSTPDYNYKTYTLKPNYTSDAKAKFYNTKEDMRRFQGYNLGTNKDVRDGSDVLNMFNSFVGTAGTEGRQLNGWFWDSLNGRPALERSIAAAAGRTGYRTFKGMVKMPEADVTYSYTWTGINRSDDSETVIATGTFPALLPGERTLETDLDLAAIASMPSNPSDFKLIRFDVTGRDAENNIVDNLTTLVEISDTYLIGNPFNEYGKVKVDFVSGYPINLEDNTPAEYEIHFYKKPNRLNAGVDEPEFVEDTAATVTTSAAWDTFTYTFPYTYGNTAIKAALFKDGEALGREVVVDIPQPLMTVTRTDYTSFSLSTVVYRDGGKKYKYRAVPTLATTGAFGEPIETALDTKRAITFTLPQDPYHYTALDFYLVNEDNELVAHQHFDLPEMELESSRVSYNSFTAQVTDHVKNEKHIYKWYTVPFGPDVTFDPENPYDGAVLLRTGAVKDAKAVKNEIFTVGDPHEGDESLPFHPDHTRMLVVAACDAAGNFYNPADPFDSRFTTVIPIDRIGVEIQRAGSTLFIAVPQTLFPTPDYKYDWNAVVENSEGDEVEIHLVTAGTGNYGSLDLATQGITDPSKYRSVSVKLLDSNNNPIYASSGEAVSASIIVRENEFYYPLEIAVQQSTHTPGDYALVGAVKDLDGNIYMGGGNVVWSDVRAVDVVDNVPVIAGSDYFWLWESSSDPVARDWAQCSVSVLLPGMTLEALQQNPNWIQPVAGERRFYRLSWCRVLRDDLGHMTYGAYGLPLYEVMRATVYGPEKVIFVYDAAKTERGSHITVWNANISKYVPIHSFDPQDFPDGNDSNSGYDPYNAVRTLKRAYELIDADRSASENIIVIMGYYYSGNVSDNANDIPHFGYKKDMYFAKPATITGEYGRLISGSAINMVGDGTNPMYLGAPTRFTDITFTGFIDPAVNAAGSSTTPAAGTLHLVCNLHDLEVDEAVKVIGYPNLNSTSGAGKLSYGLIEGSIAPSITLIGGMHNYNTLDELPERPRNKVPGVTTIEINSGAWGRIMAGTRNTSLNGISHNVFGSPTRPHRVEVKIGISHLEGKTDEYTPGNRYSYDIGLLAGGQTDGSIYGEVETVLADGSVGRYISGNLSYGRDGGEGYPSDSFFGTSTLSMRGGSIQELYGGSLGRHCDTSTGASAKCESYFYGISTLNIEGGYIKYNIYGAGSGGVAGVGHGGSHEELRLHNTLDPNIPCYVTKAPGVFEYDAKGRKKIAYKPFDDVREASSVDADGNPTFDNVVTMDLRDGSRLHLLDAVSGINIRGGTIGGNVYGGGHGFSAEIPYNLATSQAGTVFGTTYVNMEATMVDPPVVKGNIYGGGAGSSGYFDQLLAFNKAAGLSDEDAWAATNSVFGDEARVFGNCTVTLTGGTVEGDVFAGSQGIMGHHDMGTVFGNCTVNINGATVNGNIFGGCDFADIHRSHSDPDPANSGNTYVNIIEGVIGNNIFGGSQGLDDEGGAGVSETVIEGDTHLRVDGGEFIGTPFINSVDETDGFRTFNMYGGGYRNCRVDGNAYVDVSKSLMKDSLSIMEPRFNPNRTPDAISRFHSAYMDITFRRFCLYGGGWGEKTQVLNTFVTLNIPPSDVKVPPHGYTLKNFLPGQSFFDVAGGGYSGNVGYWKAHGKPGDDDYDPVAEYVGGHCNVTIDGYTYTRKVIGGGFYGSSLTTNTNVRCGSLRQVYGGSLLGYVHNQAVLSFGNRAEEFLEECGGDMDAALEKAYNLNRLIYITENIYGGNDVKGIIGTQRWVAPDGRYGIEPADGGPLYCTDVDHPGEKGVIFNIFGGTFMGDVYGAGNGHYRGYYVPEWTRYNDGPERMYRNVRSSLDPTKTGRVYRTRPMVGSVDINLRGNSETDKITILGDFFAGGRDCTIGQWNTLLPFEDPRRLVKGGHLNVNFGGYVDVRGSVYLGNQGALYADQQTIPTVATDEEHPDVLTPVVDLSTFDGSTTQELLKIGEAAYDHWWYNLANGRYEPGFPRPGQTDGNFDMAGEHMFRGYMKNIEMQGDVQLTFYRDAYTDWNDFTTRKPWLPGEKAIYEYDTAPVTMNSFFLGGLCGTMSNNTIMEYTDPVTGVKEKYDAVYRISMPENVIVYNKVVLGSQDATTTIYPYSSDFTSVDRSNGPDYVFEGGMVTQTPLTFDHILYNDKYRTYTPVGVIPDEYYTDEAYAEDREADTYTLHDGRTIHRKVYISNPFIATFHTLDDLLGSKRYGLAVDEDGNAVTGPREKRLEGTQSNQMTVTKFTTKNTFRPTREANPDNPDEDRLFGGIIYGGCYNSGVVMGDVIINVASNMLGDIVEQGEMEDYFGKYSSLEHYVGRVYGGGYGEQSRNDGDVYITLLNNFRGTNVFGGGMLGSVTGSTNINYVGSDQSVVFGAIYGGGFRGSIGTPDVTERATSINLLSGNVDRVYGGSCMGNLYGSTYVNASDDTARELPHLDFNEMVNGGSVTPWNMSHLIVGSIFGGNDIGGVITPISEALDSSPTKEYSRYSTTVVVDEVQNEATKKDEPGDYKGYSGFPLVGNVYGGSNGDYGIHGEESGRYKSGTVTIASGTSIDTPPIVVELGGDPEVEDDGLEVPHIFSSRVSLNGGTVINAYAGGDRSSILDRAEINVEYDPVNVKARAGFTSDDVAERMWYVFHLSNDQQRREVMTAGDDGTVFDYQIFHLFGGNNNHDMAIKPAMNLTRGYIESVYAGGNYGRMTYYNPNPDELAGETRGLTLTIDSPDLHAANVYGGGRVGGIEPEIPEGHTVPDDFYGATVNIHRGVVDAVYGGNDVSGDVHYGARVNITGAISGDVYCAGNGNYLYQYDPTLFNENPELNKVVEAYDDTYGRYFILPRRPGYGGDDPSPAHKLLAINSYRPNVDKAFLSIEGASADNIAFVRGNVYCGGNSSTICRRRVGSETVAGDIRFNIGNNVTLNGVFLGSNGEHLVNPTMIYNTAVFNGVDLNGANTLTDTQLALMALDPLALRDKDTGPEKYPWLLDLYVRAVDVDAVPKDFDLDPDLTNAYIGDFFVGGNSGSMLTDEPIHLTFPEKLVVYGKIVGGSNSANVYYNDRTHIGGLVAPLDPSLARTEWQFAGAEGKASIKRPEAKVNLTVKNRFQPWKLLSYTDENDILKVRLEPDVIDTGSGMLFPKTKCNVYGGCFNSGTVVGGVNIDVLSDMTAEYSAADPVEKNIAEALAAKGITDKKLTVVKAITDSTWRSFAVIGGGFGADTRMEGDARIRLLPMKNANPSVSALFGGSVSGVSVGNTTLELRDGTVLTNTYGASEAAPLYGSTQTIIGWPEYYVCRERGNFYMDRTDKISRPMKALESANSDSIASWTNYQPNETYAVRRWISLRPGDIISGRQWRLMSDTDKAKFIPVTDDDPTTFTEIEGVDFTWNDIDIHVGDSRSRSNIPGMANPAPYYGHGNIYGGGFVSNSSESSLTGKITVCRFNNDNKLSDLDVSSGDSQLSFGGNSTILIWDNKDNADTDKAVNSASGAGGAVIRDHITIGTAKYVPVSIALGQDVKNKYYWDNAESHFVYLSSHLLGCDDNGDPLPNPATDPLYGKTFYEVESDGGIYGGGRNVYVEAFRDCDLAYYGYASSTPQYAKLINTIQRFDLFSVTDCCLQLQGAVDFASNNNSSYEFSLTRVGELDMVSSLSTAAALNPGERETGGLYSVTHKQPRTRNYIGFFNDVLYLAGLTSNVSFDSPYHGATGLSGTPGTPGVTGDFDKDGHVTNGIDDTDDASYNPTRLDYRDYKLNRIRRYFNAKGNPSISDDEMEKAIKGFDRRNLGTSANMIGMNNGYTLKIQGAVVQKNGDDRTFYGPATGIIEMKLLTLTPNEGGGYVHALNYHEDPESFLESPGNFVFPGASYMLTGDEGTYHYIYDDCFPPSKGWESYPHAAHAPKPAREESEEPSTCNDAEIHYWYVSGNNFTYNVHMTGCTYNGEEPYTLDLKDQLIYLYGVEPGTTFTIQSVTWAPSQNIQPDLTYTSAGTDNDNRAAGLPYSFRLSVDNVPASPHTLAVAGTSYDNSFVSMLPRTAYKAAEGVTPPQFVDNYGKNTSKNTMPLLGITLVDPVDNSGREYYDLHLAEPEEARIVLLARTPSNEESRYIINLTVDYLLGPSITGNISIENCALPGEYIYANAFGVKVDLDDSNMGVSERNWYIAAPSVDLDDLETAIRDIAHQPIECLNTEKIDDRQIHIPAYLYRNGWRLIYEIVANNKPFYKHSFVEPLRTDDLSYNEALEVHNYHRIRPYDGVSLNYEEVEGEIVTSPRYEELMLTPGARVYIESDEDMAYFYEWLRKMQYDSPDDIAEGRTCRLTTASGQPVDPRYAEGLQVFLMADVKAPEISDPNDAVLEFRGTFHGNGHSIDLGKNLLFLGYNSGEFYNTGFVSHRKNSDPGAYNTRVFQHNHSRSTYAGNYNGGHIENCFFFNVDDPGNGFLVSEECRDTHVLAEGTSVIINCARTSADNIRQTYTTAMPGIVGLVAATFEEFQQGFIAYNINRFYLNKRLMDHVATPDADTQRTVKIVEDLYRDGNFRFAAVGAPGSTQALRKTEVPNYHDFLRIRSNITSDAFDGSVTGADATMHYVNEPIDDRAVFVTVNERQVVDHYEPRDEDYLFFGQDLTDHSLMTSYPVSIAPDHSNRVYRASGFYGTKADECFHFNRDAHAYNNRLTAIDFTGLQVTRYDQQYEKGEKYYDGALVFYPPVLDMPEEGLTSLHINASDFHDEQADKVSRNLLVYCWNDGTGNTPWSVFSPYSYTTADEPGDIYCHLIHPTAKTTRDAHTYPAWSNTPGDVNAETSLLHLIDKNDFNCPIEFRVNDRTWYEREPEYFSMGLDAWEGIALPFTVKSVEAKLAVDKIEEQPLNVDIRSHGLLTHFYGEHQPKEELHVSHEYWLRKFTGAGTGVDEGKLFFDRPGSADDKSANTLGEATDYRETTYEQLTGSSLHYSNLYFRNAFSQEDYQYLTTESAKAYTPEGVDYENYPLITARMPYIVSYPGDRFYEFDLSGRFYHSIYPLTPEVPQRISYINDLPLTIPVTDNAAPLAVRHGAYTYQGTFSHLIPAGCSAVIMGNEDNGKISDTFDRCFASTKVLPFRTFMLTPTASPVHMKITSRGVDFPGTETPTDPEQENPGEDEENPLQQIQFSVKHNALVVESPFDVQLPLYDVEGRLVRYLDIHEGKNTFRDLAPGYYLVTDFKFRIN